MMSWTRQDDISVPVWNFHDRPQRRSRSCKATRPSKSTEDSQVEMADFVDVSTEKAPDPVKEALWKDVLNLRAEVIHLKQVNWCLAHSENTERQLRLESMRLGSMVTGLLERAQLAERAQRRARQSCYQRDLEILKLREKNQALVHIVQQLCQRCQEKQCCQLDSLSQCRDLTKDRPVNHEPASWCSEKYEAKPKPNCYEEGFAVKSDQRKSVLDGLDDEHVPESKLRVQLKDSAGSPSHEVYLWSTTSSLE